MERLLSEIAEQGWSARSREEFVRLYDRQIGAMILDLLVEYGLDRRALRSLKSYVEHRLRGPGRGSEHPVWETVEEVYMRVYKEIFEKKLIGNYVTGVRDRTVQVDFAGYLKGAVRRRLLDVLGGGKKSEKELLDAIVDSKKPQTQRQHIAEAKGRFGAKVRSYLLGALASEYQRSLRVITDYFFERFIIEAYPALRLRLKSGGSALLALLEAFIQRHGRAPGEELMRYVGQIAPSLPRARSRGTACRAPTHSEGEEERLEQAGAVVRTKDPAQSERLYWWDRLLRCRKPTDVEITQLHRMIPALEGDAQRDTKLCLACVQLKAASTPEQQDDLRMFLVYYLSNYGAAPLTPPRGGEGSSPFPRREGGQGVRLGEGEVTRETLSLERVRGRTLSWEQIFTIFGRECNPSRVKNRIREKFEALQGGR